MTWLIWATGIVGAIAIGWLVYRFTGSTEQRYCVACKETRPWHPTKGCSVCRTLDSVF